MPTLDTRVGPQIRAEMRRNASGCNIFVMCAVFMLGILIGRGPLARSWPTRVTPPSHELPPEPASSPEANTAALHRRRNASLAVLGSSPLPSNAALLTHKRKHTVPWLKVRNWEPTPRDAPWYFPSASGGTSRARQQLEMRKNCGYQQRDSPLASSATKEQPVLSGTAWHHGQGNCPASCALHGVCSPDGRCDCGPYFWGPDCSTPVITQRICVYNDSRPWFCDKPACIHSQAERVSAGGVTTACVGNPLAACPRQCSGRGRCDGAKCTCFEGFEGDACERELEYGVDKAVRAGGCLGQCSGRGICERGFCHCTPPYWGADCALGPAGGPRCRRRPCVYVYELPARMNVLALKVEPDWRQQIKGRKFDYRAGPLVHEVLLKSAHRTTDPAEADLYYVPTWDWHGAWGNPEVYYRAHRYITTVYPFWNASGGADHVWTIARDAGACATPWGSLLEELQSSILLSNWGGVTGLSGSKEERCFRPNWDIVLPGTLKAQVVHASPWLLPPTEQAAQFSKRTTQLFFFGALCWKTDQIIRFGNLDQLKAKCDRSYGQPGFLSKYSFGLRYEIFTKFRNTKGFKLYATDFPSSLPPGRIDINEEILSSRFCLCPSGTGWGMRVFHVLVLGCIPVLTQHDGIHPPVAQAFDPEVLHWDQFAVVVSRDQISRLPEVLNAVQIDAKRDALRQVWTRTVWADLLPLELRSKLKGPDAFDTMMQALAMRVSRNVSTP